MLPRSERIRQRNTYYFYEKKFSLVSRVFSHFAHQPPSAGDRWICPHACDSVPTRQLKLVANSGATTVEQTNNKIVHRFAVRDELRVFRCGHESVTAGHESPVGTAAAVRRESDSDRRRAGVAAESSRESAAVSPAPPVVHAARVPRSRRRRLRCARVSRPLSGEF